MKARIISYGDDGDVKFSTTCSCVKCYYSNGYTCHMLELRISDIEESDCPFPTVLDVLVAKECYE